MSARLKALCCTCGSIRTCSRPRNHRGENYWFAGPIDLDWHRETGDLKCDECGRTTTHALIHPEADTLRDHAEMMQRVATGNSHGHFNQAQLAELRSKYRQGFPRNPYVKHFWWCGDAKDAWDTGRRTVLSICGEPMEVDRDPSGPASKSPTDDADDHQIRPKTIRDQEYEDDETGLWWTETDCVDCLRVWHLTLLGRRRVVLIEKMTAFVGELVADNAGGYPKRIDLRTVNALIEALETARRDQSVNTEDASQ